jgi:hypothetical protein
MKRIEMNFLPDAMCLRCLPARHNRETPVLYR